MKKRILWCGEASYLSTGYSTYQMEVLSRLHKTGKYTIMELSSYGPPGDPREAEIPWLYETTMPRDDEERRIYDSDPLNQFGAWKFEEACIKFQPDVVCSIRDPWMDEMIYRSPMRPYFKHIYMPTVDAAPQQEQWIDQFIHTDMVLTYTDWAQDVLRRQGGDKINLVGTAPAGVDLEIFRPVANKAAHRSEMEIDPDLFIVGMVARNQSRKLYPDLFEAFVEFLQSVRPDEAQRAFLYIHTAWPDVGWDIPRLIKENGLSGKVVMTYACGDCGAVYPSFFSDSRAVCKMCGGPNATFPTSKFGISRQILSHVYNLFDCLVQYCNSEGQGIPQVEAAACGVPVFATDYSGMSDVVRKVNGYPIKVQRFYREAETHCKRALPDNSDLVKQLTEFMRLPAPMRARASLEAREGAEEHYTWDKTATVWDTLLSRLPANPGAWRSQYKPFVPNLNVPEGLNQDEFVRWGLINIANRPDLIDTYVALRMVRDLNWQARLPYTGGVYFNEQASLGQKPRFTPYHQPDAIQDLENLCRQKEYWEKKRHEVAVEGEK